MRLAVIGKMGQLARAIAARHEDAQLYSRQDCDLSGNPNDIYDFVKNIPDCDALIIAAAYTAVDAAETDQDTAFAVNAFAPEAIAKACKVRGIPLVHVSTDYVFQGHGTSPYKTGDALAPQSVYGASKAAGEKYVLAAYDNAAILRTSWVFDGTGKNFFTTMLKLAQTRDALTVVADQIGRPTYAGHLATACIEVARKLTKHPQNSSFRGLYHVSGSGEPISWADFSRAIFTRADKTTTVSDIPSTDYPTPAARPPYSVLNISRFEDTLYPLPHWKDGLEEAYKEWVGAQNNHET
ncbi:MAG: dTDP-4-dehydrorhamnose reductase [Maricaulaceae bacterium]